MEKTRLKKDVIKSMISFFEKFQEIPVKDRQALEAAYQNSNPANPCHYSSGQFTYSDYSWRIDMLKEILAKMDKETARVKKCQAKKRRGYY